MHNLTDKQLQAQWDLWTRRVSTYKLYSAPFERANVILDAIETEMHRRRVARLYATA